MLKFEDDRYQAWLKHCHDATQAFRAAAAVVSAAEIAEIEAQAEEADARRIVGVTGQDTIDARRKLDEAREALRTALAGRPLPGDAPPVAPPAKARDLNTETFLAEVEGHARTSETDPLFALEELEKAETRLKAIAECEENGAFVDRARALLDILEGGRAWKAEEDRKAAEAAKPEQAEPVDLHAVDGQAAVEREMAEA